MTLEEINRKIEEQHQKLRSNAVSAGEAAEALQHHLTQLGRLGATLEDDVCAVLRKYIAQEEARTAIAKLEEEKEWQL